MRSLNSVTVRPFLFLTSLFAHGLTDTGIQNFSTLVFFLSHSSSGPWLSDYGKISSLSTPIVGLTLSRSMNSWSGLRMRSTTMQVVSQSTLTSLRNVWIAACILDTRIFMMIICKRLCMKNWHGFWKRTMKRLVEEAAKVHGTSKEPGCWKIGDEQEI